MTKQGRILILDDLPQWRKELVETLRNNGFQADAVDTVAQALEHLNTYLYHVLVLDIRMDGANQSNTEGISLLEELVKQGLNEATKVIILSAYGTKEQMRKAFKDYEVADFLAKDNPFNKQIFLESVQQVFSQKVNINLSLKIHWQPKSAFEKALLNLEIKGTSLKSASPVQKQMVAAELEDLLCRLFYQCESVVVHPLTPGWSGTGVLRIQPFYKNTGGARDVVIKFGEIDKLKKEYHNFKQYVQPFVGGGHNTTVLDVRRTTQLGGVMYSLLGTASDKLDDFGTFYRQSDLPQIRSALDRLFRDTCGPWYANHGRLQPLDLSAEYQGLLGYTTKKLEQALARQLKSVQGKQEFYFKSLNNERTFTNPLTATARVSLVRSTYTCITHGDFNQHNLLVDSIGNMWLIDFQRTGQGHILGDVAMLDSVVRLQLLATSEATLEERLQMEEALCSIGRFSQLEQLADSLPTENAALIKAYATVIHLRTLARKLVSQNPNDDISEYYIALLYHAMNTVRFNDLSLTQREHALLCASLLVDRLGLRKA